MPLGQDAGETPDGEIRLPKGGRGGDGRRKGAEGMAILWNRNTVVDSDHVLSFEHREGKRETLSRFSSWEGEREGTAAR